MIGLDTNVFVRYFVKDDPEQTRLAVDLVHALSPSEPGWVGQATLLELVWATTRIYRIDKADVIRILDTLLASRDLVIEFDNTVRAALRLFRKGNADFADCLIGASARAAGCSRTVTFDRVAARDAGMQLLE
jgi:predicted nucleic-acid-binding protein